MRKHVTARQLSAGVRRGLVLTFALLAVALPAAPARAAAATHSGAPPRTAAASRWVAVSVATLWVRPGTARPIDLPALTLPADPGAWVRRMSVAQKRWLVGRLETQVLYGQRVLVLGTSGGWSRVAVPAQPTPRSSLGYPGWVKSVQLTAKAPQQAASIAVIRRPTARLWTTAALRDSAAVLSYGTRLPVAMAAQDLVEVLMLDGRQLFVRRAAVELRAAGAPAPSASGATLVSEARRFLGLGYLWGGASGFGFDCSGFTCCVFRTFGIRLPRDAGAQSAMGVKVRSRSALRAGDLVFFRASSGRIHHVGVYAGDGAFIHSPATGRAVTISSLSQQPYAGEFAGGRRFLEQVPTARTGRLQ
jgi:gamma-D-glutamyl-L-lysine dipeptidyl-peptidase